MHKRTGREEMTPAHLLPPAELEEVGPATFTHSRQRAAVNAQPSERAISFSTPYCSALSALSLHNMIHVYVDKQVLTTDKHDALRL